MGVLGIENGPKMVEKSIFQNWVPMAESRFFGLWGVFWAPRGLILPMQPSRNLAKIPPFGAKMGQKSVKSLVFRRYWGCRPETPKVGAPPASRTCFHTTRTPEIASNGPKTHLYRIFHPTQGKIRVLGGQQ